jgi:hypothetical protein
MVKKNHRKPNQQNTMFYRLKKMMDDTNDITPKIFCLALGMYIFDEIQHDRILSKFDDIKKYTLETVTLATTKKHLFDCETVQMLLKDLQRVLDNIDFLRADLKNQNICPIGNHEIKINEPISLLPCGHSLCEKCFVEYEKKGISKCVVCNQDYIIFFGIPRPEHVKIDDLKEDEIDDLAKLCLKNTNMPSVQVTPETMINISNKIK